MSDNPLSRKVELDLTNYKAGIAEMNRSIRVIESGFRASAAALGDWSKDATTLEARINALNGTIDLQRAKVDGLRGVYEQVAAEQGTNSRAAQELEIKLNKETETLGKMEAELSTTEGQLANLTAEQDDAGKSAEDYAGATDEAASSTDRFQGILDGLKGTLASVKTGFKDLGDKVLGAVKTGLLAVGAAATGVAVAFVGLLSKAIPAASDLGETINKVNVIFGDASEAVLDFAKDAASSLGQSQQQALDAAATFAQFGKAAGLSGSDLSDFSITLTGLASDLASFNNSTPEEAITAIGAALRGESEPLRSFGVLLDDATLKAKAVELGLISTTTEALTPQQKVLAAYNVILDQTTDAQGDFARTSTGLANSQRIVSAGFADLVSGLGQGFLPVVESLLNNLVIPLIPKLQELAGVFTGAVGPALSAIFASDTVQTGIQNLVNGVSDFATKIATMAEALLAGDIQGALLTLFPPELVEQILAISAGVQSFISQLVAFVTEHAEAIQNAFIAIGAVLAGAGIVAALTAIINPINLIIAAVALLAAAWTEDWGGIRSTLETWWNESGQALFETLKEWLETNIPIALQTLSDFWTTVLQPALEQVWTWIQGTLLPLLADLWAWLKTNLPEALETLGDFWENTLQPAIENVWGWISGTLFPLLTDLWDWLEVTIPAALETLAGFWENTLQPALEIVWGFISESVLPLLNDLWTLIETGLGVALTAFAGVWENVLQPAVENFWNLISDTVKPGLDLLESFWTNTFQPAFENVDFIDTLAGAFDGLKQAITFVRDIIQSVINKLAELGENLPDWATPGSPMPLETAMWGLGRAMDDVAKKRLAALSQGFKGLENPLGAAEGAGTNGGAAPGDTTIYQLQANYAYQSPRSLMQELRLRELMAR